MRETLKTRDHQSMIAGAKELNTVRPDDLKACVGEHRANLIMQKRDEIGRFTDYEQLKSILGVGPKTYETIKKNFLIRGLRNRDTSSNQ